MAPIVSDGPRDTEGRRSVVAAIQSVVSRGCNVPLQWRNVVTSWLVTFEPTAVHTMLEIWKGSEGRWIAAGEGLPTVDGKTLARIGTPTAVDLRRVGCSEAGVPDRSGGEGDVDPSGVVRYPVYPP